MNLKQNIRLEALYSNHDIAVDAEKKVVYYMAGPRKNNHCKDNHE